MGSQKDCLGFSDAEATWKVSFVCTRSAYLQKLKIALERAGTSRIALCLTDSPSVYLKVSRSQCDPVQIGPL